MAIRSYWYVLYAIYLPLYASLSQDFDSRLELENLQNICQLTSTDMGFSKCGEGYFSQDGSKIIFQAVPYGKEHYQIYVMDIAEKLPRMVSTGLGACTCAYFRPDGKKIIFASSHEDPQIQQENFIPAVPGYQRQGGSYMWEFTPYMNIYEANVDGSDLRPLTSGPAYSAECAYAPDGSHIVFASNRSGSMHIYTMQSDGSHVQQLTSGSNCYNGGPFFSPDGEHIVFRADREKPHYLQIYLMKSDGSAERQLTYSDAVNWAPFWHPNGQVIAFTTSLHGHAHYEIYALSLENGKAARMTYNSTFDGLAVFDSSGTKMLWTSKRAPDGSCQLFMADFQLPKALQ